MEYKERIRAIMDTIWSAQKDLKMLREEIENDFEKARAEYTNFKVTRYNEHEYNELSDKYDYLSVQLHTVDKLLEKLNGKN